MAYKQPLIFELSHTQGRRRGYQGQQPDFAILIHIQMCSFVLKRIPRQSQGPDSN